METPENKKHFYDRLADAILSMDPRHVGVGIVVITFLLVIIHRWRQGYWPNMADPLRGAATLVGCTTAFAIFAIFNLTEPPAINKLSGTERQVVGAVAFIAVLGFALREFREVFLKAWEKNSPQSGGNATSIIVNDKLEKTPRSTSSR